MLYGNLLFCTADFSAEEQSRKDGIYLNNLSCSIGNSIQEIDSFGTTWLACLHIMESLSQ
jgi:hypothetical protein